MVKNWLVGMLACFVCFGFGAGYTEAENLDKETLDQIDDYVKRQFEANDITGGSYAIVSNGKVVAASGLGVKDADTEEPVTPETVYATASVTKVFTATAVLQLYEKGMVNLDAPVQDYLPWFTYEDQLLSSKVTVRNLLTHAAGINRLEGDGALFNNEEANRNSLEDSVRALRSVSMAAEPGTKAAYCNSCFNTLGLMVEKTTDTDYEVYIEEKILAPLSMEDTTFNPGTVENLASEYNWVFGLKHKSVYNNLVFGESQNPEGGIYSNVLDLSKFLAALMEGSESPVLQEDTRRLSQQGEIASGSDAEYAVSGFEETSIAGTKVLYKSGDGIGSGAMVMMIPEIDAGISILVGDSVPEFAGPLAKGIAEILLGDSPDEVEVGMTFWKMTGLISLMLTVVSLAAAAMLIRMVIFRRYAPVSLKRKWMLAVSGIVCLLVAIPIGYLLLMVRPSQIGFYGYPVDVAVGLVSITVSSFLGAVYSFIRLFQAVRRNS